MKCGRITRLQERTKYLHLTLLKGRIGNDNDRGNDKDNDKENDKPQLM